MPKVGKKEFSYSDKGKAEAKAYAEKTGQNIEKGSSPMAYESKDARNRSQVYKEGGEVKPRHTPDRAPSMREAMLHKGGVKKSEKIEKNIKDFPELYKGYKSFKASKEKKKK